MLLKIKRVCWFTKDTCGAIKRFFKNIYVFRRTLCGHRAWDYSGIFLATEDALSDMINYGMPHIKGGNRYIKQMKIAKELSKRIREDNYVSDKFDIQMDFGEIENGKKYGSVLFTRTPLHDFPTNTKLCYSVDYRKQDMDALTKMLNKHLFSWWD